MSSVPLDPSLEMAFGRLTTSQPSALRQGVRALLDHVVALSGALGAIVEQCDGDDLIYAVASQAFVDREGFRLRRAGSLSGLTMQSRTAQHCSDATLDRRVDRAACQALGLRSMICCPLEVGDQFLVLKVKAAEPHAFDPDRLSAIMATGERLEHTLRSHAAGAALDLAPRAPARISAIVGASEPRPRLVASRQVLDVIEQAGELGWWTLNPGNLDMHWSEGLYRLLGADSRRDVARLDDLLSWTHADDRAALQRVFTDLTWKDPLVARLLGSDGALRWIRFSRETRAADRVHFGLAQDVTAVHGAKQGLSRYHRAFESLAKLISGMIWRADAEGSLSFELGWCAYTGTTLAQNQGDGWVDRLHPDDRASAARAWRQARDTGSAFVTRFRVRRYDGVYELFDSRALTPSGDEGLEWIGVTLPVGTETTEVQTQEAAATPRPRELKALRALADWTIEDLAVKSGVSASTITRYERGELSDAPIRAVNLERLTRALAARGFQVLDQGGRRSIVAASPSSRS